MKKYIFFSTCDLHDMGGSLLYYLGKTEYLERHGWEVIMFHPGNNIPNCAIKELNKYVDGSLKWPGNEWRYSKSFREKYFKELIKRIGYRVNDEIIFETHDFWTSPWVELLALRVKAKHIIKQLNEWTDQARGCFEKDRDFYEFKLQRRELFSSIRTLKIIFGEKRDLKKEDSIPFRLNENPVRDVDCLLINEMPYCDLTIGYIGRAKKRYLPNIIDGVCDFAQRHSDKKILFVTLGDFSCRKDYYVEKSKDISNLALYELGDMFPIPRSLFGKVNVVIAGSGSARCSVEEGALTLVADVKNYLCNGLLGYETQNSVYQDESTIQSDFSEGLERTLIEKVYNNLSFNYNRCPSVEECCEQNFKVIKESNQSKEYYSERKLCKFALKTHIKRFILSFLSHFLPKTSKHIITTIRDLRNRKKDKAYDITHKDELLYLVYTDYFRQYGREITKEVYKEFLHGKGVSLSGFRLLFVYRHYKYQLGKNKFSGETLKWKRKYDDLCERLGAEIPIDVTIGKGFIINHTNGIVLNPGAVFGDNCSIQHQVTIGNTRKSKNLTDVAILGSGCTIGAGAKLIGPVKIGNNVAIGANAVVTHDVQDNCSVGGVPARVITENREYIGRNTSYLSFEEWKAKREKEEAEK